MSLPEPVRPRDPVDRTRAALLDVDALAAMVGVSTRTVRRLVDAGKFPQPVRLGGCVRWSRVVVEAWIAAGCPNCRKWRGVAR
jgi:excisionase family DNA binding protein